MSEAMYLIPAVDILDGKAVRLYQGDYSKVTVYHDNPVDQALALADSGVRRIHLVDLDAARGQGKTNRALISRICSRVDCVVETGGGIRSAADVRELLDAGVDWLIVGTALVKAPEEVRGWIQAAPGHFIAGIDVRDGMVKISGWEGDSALTDTEAVRRAAELGFSQVVYTNIGKDGTLAGPDLANSLRVAREGSLPVVISGGVGSMDHVRAAFAHEGAGREYAGIIIGKAWYEGHIDLPRLCREFPQKG